jgi:hypothetical protein
MNEKRNRRSERTVSLEERVELATLRRAIHEGQTSVMEEHVLRLRYGIGEADDHVLRSKDAGHEEARAKMAMMEMDLLGMVAGGVEAGGGRPATMPNRDRILDTLKRLR